MSNSETSATFHARHAIEYTYRRSVGPVLGHFFTALRERKIVGIRSGGGRVLVPPSEHDPDTGEALEDFGLVDLDGHAVRLADFRGHRLVLTFERSLDW